MLIPLGTDQTLKRRPIVNESLITVNLLVYLYGLIGHYFGRLDFGELQSWGQFDPQNFRAWQLITYQFMHDPTSIFHILFNMVFLWIFGNAVEGRLGRFGYLGFYLAGGAAAAVAHGLASQAPVIGASGSVAAVTGAFLALFPRSRIKVLLIFFIIGIVYIPALWFIGFYFMIDVANQIMEWTGRGGRRVAYAAHLAGYLYGFGVCFALLALGMIKRHDVDVFYLFKQMRRRQAFKTTVQKSPGMWDQPERKMDDRRPQRAAKPLTRDQEAQAEARAEINRLLAEHELPAAAARYRDLLRDYPDAVMPERRQLDLANQLYAEGDHEIAAKAYELLVAAYPTCRDADGVRLILGMLYTRNLARHSRAKELLAEVRPRLAGAERDLADDLLGELGVRIPDDATATEGNRG